MNSAKYILPLFILVVSVTPGRSQNGMHGETEYLIETYGSAASDKYTPFWMVSNKYGAVPLEAGNAHLRTGIYHNQSTGKNLRWNAGIEVLTVTPRYRNVYIQQLYVGIKYKCLDLTIGSKEKYTSLWDRDLSSGDLVLSANARPIPEINLAISQFTPVPFTHNILLFKGDFAVGHSFDTDYIEQIIHEKQYFTKNTLWHHKSLFFKLIDPLDRFPLSAVFGIRHHAQWGGTSTNPEVGKQPHSFKDFLRILVGNSGDNNSYHADKNNTLGNHYGSYDLKIGYLNTAFDIHVYHQHYYDDISGMSFYNFPDGLYGIQADFFNNPWIRKVVFEYICTRDQSGPIHYILYDHDEYPGYGGGADDYYNNYGYRAGISYFNRSLGSPLLTSPEYNTNGDIDFQNNRIRAFHLGLQGYLSRQVAYRLLTTRSEGWGTMNRPFLKKETNFSCAARVSYCHPRLEGWFFSGEIGADFGPTYGDNVGFGISIRKSGILKQF